MFENGNVVFVCSMCGDVKLMDESIWQKSVKQLPTFQENSELKNFDNIENWKYFQEFQKLISLTKDSNIPSLPLCDSCLELAISHTKILNDLLDNFNKNVGNIEKYSSIFNPKDLSSQQVISPFNVPKKESSAAELKPQILNDSNQPVNQKIEKLPNSKIEQNPIQRNITPRFAQFSAFRLTIDGMFAKINGLRIGKLKTVVVPTSEVQNALYFLCQFLLYQMRIFKIDSSNIKVSSNIIFSAPNGDHELKFPEKRAEVKGFNIALDRMMISFDKIFNSDELAKMRPSNLIDSEKHSISGKSYHYSESDPSLFTRAMRKLIVNLKTIQSFQTVYSF